MQYGKLYYIKYQLSPCSDDNEWAILVLKDLVSAQASGKCWISSEGTKTIPQGDVI